ncbi:hypothetical protein KQX54_010046 [Cotesia glomerata]|uniref:Uncharacterized protein n=1 Tax=Cotesia glomerata TaxID=32391 RepID=A0AAV7I8M7_COTGL|nr:hypothetical protein KQX54_010046 [Cotesia glomerata]
MHLIRSDIDSKLDAFNELISDVLDEVAPEKTFVVNRPLIPWLTVELRNLKRERDACYRASKRRNSISLFARYVELRPDFKRRLSSSKTKYLELASGNVLPSFEKCVAIFDLEDIVESELQFNLSNTDITSVERAIKRISINARGLDDVSVQEYKAILNGILPYSGFIPTYLDEPICR